MNERSTCTPLPLATRIRLFPCKRTASRTYSSVENGHGTPNHRELTIGEKVATINAKIGIANENGIGSDASTRTDSLSGSNSGGRLLVAGEVAGDYSQDWKSEKGIYVSFYLRRLMRGLGIFFLRACAQRTFRGVKPRRCSLSASNGDAVDRLRSFVCALFFSFVFIALLCMQCPLRVSFVVSFVIPFRVFLVLMFLFAFAFVFILAPRFCVRFRLPFLPTKRRFAVLFCPYLASFFLLRFLFLRW